MKLSLDGKNQIIAIMKDNRLALNPASLSLVLAILALLLVIASMGGQVFKYLTDNESLNKLIQFFNVDNEQNLPTSFIFLLLIFVSLLAAIIAILKRKNHEFGVIYWAILSLGFLYLAGDEFMMLHERLIIPVQHMFNKGNHNIFYVAWVIPGLLIVAVTGIFFLRFLFRLPRKTRNATLIAAGIYVSGIILFEIISGMFCTDRDMTDKKNILAYYVIANIEEALEMGGVILFIKALLTYIGDSFNEVRFMFKEVSNKAEADSNLNS